MVLRMIKHSIFLASLLCCLPAAAQTQLEMNMEFCGEYQKAIQKLDAVYRQVLMKHEADEAFVEKLKAAQKAWLAFRDAEMDALYPAGDKRLEYGSVYPMCRCIEQSALVNERIEQLSGWLSAEEGDVCRGSR